MRKNITLKFLSALGFAAVIFMLQPGAYPFAMAQTAGSSSDEEPLLPTAAGGAKETTPLEIPNFFDDEPSHPDNGNVLPPAADIEDGSSEGGDGKNFDFEKSKAQLEQEARREAYDAALQGLLPLRPEEIRELLEHFDRTQESVETPVYPNPKPEVAVETISLDPGAKPAVVKVAYGNVTTVNILDVSGAPWPIEDISWAGNFEVVEASSGDGSHIIRISPQSEFANGNMSIRLLTLKTPVIIALETSRDIVHYRFDAIIPQYGPMAEVPLIDKGLDIQAGDTDIASVLQGVMPNGGNKLNVTGVDGRTTAYSLNGMTYVRTPLTLLSPSWNSSVSSADGTHVYTIPSAPVLLLSDKGKMVRAHLSKREDILDER